MRQDSDADCIERNLGGLSGISDNLPGLLENIPGLLVGLEADLRGPIYAAEAKDLSLKEEAAEGPAGMPEA